MGARVGAAALLYDSRVQVYAPVVVVVNSVVRARQKGADVAAEVQDFAPLPRGPSEQSVEVRELREPGGDEIPREPTPLPEEGARTVNKQRVVSK